MHVNLCACVCIHIYVYTYVYIFIHEYMYILSFVLEFSKGLFAVEHIYSQYTHIHPNACQYQGKYILHKYTAYRTHAKRIYRVHKNTLKLTHIQKMLK